MGKVRKGSGGRIQKRRDGSKGMTATPQSQGKVLLCENCGRAGEHRNTREVRQCFGRQVMLGRDFRWVRS